MNAVTIMEDVNSYASISQEDTTAPACKATPYRVMTHLVKVYSIKNVKMSKRVGMGTRIREMAMEILGEEGRVTPISGDAYHFNGVHVTCGFLYHSGWNTNIFSTLVLVRATLQESKRRKIKHNIEALCDKLCIAI